MRLFSTEQVSRYHPDKYADQVSDAILDACLAQDPNSHVGCETLVKDNTIVLGGEISTRAIIDPVAIARRVGIKLGYQVDQVINLLGVQSPEINAAVSNPEEIGAGDQGMMFGYACDESPAKLPYGFDLANRIIAAIEYDVLFNPGTLLRGDAKTQVTVDLDVCQGPRAIHTILISACHYGTWRGITITLEHVRAYIRSLLWARNITLGADTILLINPAGLWTIGGPTSDCGVTGRKIVCDQYGGYVAVGGGAFSGKDPSKVDRSAAYMARHLAKEIIARHGLHEATVQLAYAIGVPEPVSINVRTGQLALDRKIIQEIDPKTLTPRRIIERLNLTKINYETIAEGCHHRGNEW